MPATTKSPFSGKLTDHIIANLGDQKAQQFIGDGQGLYLRVGRQAKTWIQRVQVEGKRQDHKLGSYPTVSIDDAREIAHNNRVGLWKGENPFLSLDATRAKMPTFRQAAESAYKKRRGDWRSDHHTNAWWRSLELHVLPVIGERHIDTIDQREVLAVLEPLTDDGKHETAIRIRGRMREIFAWAQVRKYILINPAGEVLGNEIRRPKTLAVQHLSSVPHGEVNEVLTMIRTYRTAEAVRLALEFQILTGVRPAEARMAQQQEIDAEKRIWVIPAERMKAGAEHRVPLSDQAMEVYKQAVKLHDGSEWLFPSAKKPGVCVSANAVLKMMRGIGRRETCHGFRSSLRNWCSDAGQPRELAEIALAHAFGSTTERSYRRTDLIERRRELMSEWANYINSAKVVPIGSSRTRRSA